MRIMGRTLTPPRPRRGPLLHRRPRRRRQGNAAARRQARQDRGPAGRASPSPTRSQYAQVLLTGVLDTGERLDVTRMADVEKPANVKVSPTGVVRPTADGSGVLKFTLAGQTATHPRQGDGAERQIRGQLRPRRDADHVAHRLQRRHLPRRARTARTASNSRSAATTRIFDHRSLTDDLEGRRFNRAAPDTSLMLLKPSSEVPHVGGVLTQPGRAVLRIAAGLDRSRRQARSRTARAWRSWKCSRRAPSSRCRG